MGINKNATPEKIKAAYRKLTEKIQPDKNILMTGPVSEPKKIEVNLDD